ncbi:MAG: fumarylacetoacetate hydrolase family protein [Maricaulaceae bacterium]|jgi:2-keto-4-pentenoate hydratase/2-oxohepta-3-ene-1,7-dioic acid hydratase in catechol pathway
MKLVSYEVAGRSGFGAVKDGGIVEFNGRLGAVDLRDLLEQGALGAARDFLDANEADRDLGEVTLAPVIPNPNKVFCVGLNYEGHRVETNSPLTDNPQIFARFADSLAGHDRPLVRPIESEAFDYEGELAVVIGRPGRRISESDALDHVAGYSCFNDGSVRDWQKHTSQFIPGKNFPQTGALGPWLVTRDEIEDPGALHLRTILNGDVVQEDDTSNMLFSVPRVMSYCSSFTALSAGDVIVTGTPSGVGYRRSPPLFLKPGDVVEVEISKVGTLKNHVRADTEN